MQSSGRLTCRQTLLTIVLAVLSGCARSQPVPAYSSSAAGSAAIESFDKNGSRSLDAEEAAKSPGLQTAFSRIDADKDGSLSESEIAGRIAAYRDSQIGLMPLQCMVTINGVPAEGAEVKLVPEPFLTDTLSIATGIVGASGIAVPQAAESEIPAISCGLYRVEVSWKKDGREVIPPSYNAETTLGLEVAPDVPNLERGVHFDLKVE